MPTVVVFPRCNFGVKLDFVVKPVPGNIDLVFSRLSGHIRRVYNLETSEGRRGGWEGLKTDHSLIGGLLRASDWCPE